MQSHSDTGDHQLPPHAPDAERGVLGCVLVDPQFFPDAAEAIKDPTAFYDLRHQVIWKAVSDQFTHRGTLDVLSLSEDLRGSGQLESVGGLSYINELLDSVPSAANLGYYLELLLEKQNLRRLLKACTEAVRDIYSDRPAGEIITSAQANVLGVTEAAAPSREREIRGIMTEVVEVLDEFAQSTKVMMGYSTGFNYLDNIMGGWEPGNFYVVSGRPGGGKTSLLIDILRHASAVMPCAFFSLEMQSLVIAMRMLAAEARISFQKFRNGYLSKAAPSRLVLAAGRVADRQLWIDDTSSLSGRDILTRARRMIRQHGIKLIAVDYIQIMGCDENYREMRDRVTAASAWLKRIAKTLNVPVIAAAQLNREAAKSANERRPELSDLAESDAIGRDADFVGALYRCRTDKDTVNPRLPLRDAQLQFNRMDHRTQREWYWLRRAEVDKDDTERAWSEYLQRRNLAIVKQRNGQEGDVDLLFYPEQMRFADCWKPERDPTSAVPLLELEQEPAAAEPTEEQAELIS